MNNNNRMSAGVIVCIVLASVIVVCGVIAAFIFVGTIDSGNTKVNSIDEITSGIQYTVAVDTHIYEKPDESSAALAQVKKDVKVNFIGYADNGFYEVSISGVRGYINGDYIIDRELLDQQAEAQKKNMYIVNVKDAANMYAVASTTGGKAATIPLGTQVAVYTSSDQNGMKMVEYNGVKGFVEPNYLSEDYTLVQNQQKINSEEAARAAEAQRLASLPAGSSATQVKYPMWVCNVQNSIYLRTNPSEAAPVITTIPLNTKVYYIDTCGSWYKISYNGQMGYSKVQYLTASEPYTPSYNPSYSSSYRTVTGVKHSVYLRVRAIADTSQSNIICEVPLGATVRYLGTVGDYTKVSYSGYTGYISSQYLR